MKEDIIEILKNFITPNRYNKIEQVLKNRTRYITIVLEDIYQPHNASAVLRTCDCLGIQDVYIIENKNKYNINPDVTLGSEKWLTLTKFNKKEFNTPEAIEFLKNKGYRIIATCIDKKATSLEDFDISKGKFALFFGTELTGLTSTVINNADECLYIPMYGFTESYNISVSAAIILYTLVHKLKKTNIQWHLSDEELVNLKIEWMSKNLKNKDIEKILNEHKKDK